jgi:hypothetical protein
MSNYLSYVDNCEYSFEQLEENVRFVKDRNILREANCDLIKVLLIKKDEELHNITVLINMNNDYLHDCDLPRNYILREVWYQLSSLIHFFIIGEEEVSIEHLFHCLLFLRMLSNENSFICENQPICSSFELKSLLLLALKLNKPLNPGAQTIYEFIQTDNIFISNNNTKNKK